MFKLDARFLIVEDSSVSRNIVRTALKQLNYKHIDEASNGQSGWAQILKSIESGCGHDLIVTDVNMPEMDGLKLLEMIKTDPRTQHIPVLIVTAESGKQTVIKAVMSGVSGYMVKPFGVQDVKNKMREIYNKIETAASGAVFS